MPANTRVFLLLLCGAVLLAGFDIGSVYKNQEPPTQAFLDLMRPLRTVQLLAGVRWLRILTCLPGDAILNAGYSLRYISLLPTYLDFLATCSPISLRGLNATDLRIDHPAESRVMPPFGHNCIYSYTQSQTREFGTGALRRHDLVPTRRSRVRGQEERRGWRRQKFIEMHIDLAIPLPPVSAGCWGTDIPPRSLRYPKPSHCNSMYTVTASVLCRKLYIHPRHRKFRSGGSVSSGRHRGSQTSSQQSTIRPMVLLRPENHSERHNSFPLLTWAAHKLDSRGIDSRTGMITPVESGTPIEPILNSFSCLAVSGSEESDLEHVDAANKYR